MRKRIVSLLMALVMVFSLIPTTVFAAEHDNQVRVIVENTTFHKADGAAWEGTLVDRWVNLGSDSTIMSCIVDALGTYSQTGAESGFITEINGLKNDPAAGEWSGWMGTLNDWFTNEGFKDFTVDNGKLTAGDEIRVMYTCTGDDLGGSWDNQDKTVKELTISAGTLTPSFDKDTHNYTLTIDKDTTPVVVTPTASNKNYQVRTSVGTTEYKRSAEIPVSDGTVITVKCGDPSWPSMNTNTGAAEVYTVTVKQEGGTPAVTTANVTIRSQAAGDYLHGITTMNVSSDAAEEYGFTDEVDGVSALDALVEAHKLAFGNDFTAATAKDYLDVNSAGWINTIFGVTTYACGFYVNEGYPNDGTPVANGKGYNGTMVTNTELTDDDVVDFYIMEDGTSWSDYYTWVDAPAAVSEGQEITVTVKGFYAMEGYRYKTPAELKAAATAVEGLQLGWVDPETGAFTAIENAITDENGQATFVVNSDDATGYLAAASYGDADEDGRVYALMNPTEKIRIASGQSVVFTGMHSAQLDSLKVYSYTDGVKGDVDLLDGVEAIAVNSYGAKKYETKLPAGDYLVEGYDANNDFNGSLVLTVKEGENTFALQRVYQINASNSGWVKDTDYKIDLKVTGPDGTDLKATLGTATSSKGQAWEATYPSCIFQERSTIEVVLTPIGDKAEDYLPLTLSKNSTDTAPGKGALSMSGSIPQKLGVTVVAPAGSTVDMGIQSDYYTYKFADQASSVENKQDDTVKVVFDLPSGGKTNFVRVQHPDGVTYWTFGKFTDAQTIEVSRDDLHMDDSVSKDTVYHFDNNVYDLGNIFLNINRQGYLTMEAGQTFELNVLRNWQAIESFFNSQIALPDVHYKVVSFDGSASDVVTITPDEKNSSLADITANKAGTAIVLVTYDAMTHMQGQTSNKDNHMFSAIWPEFTGVFVVSVGADGSAIQTNTFIDRPGTNVTKEEQKYLDAEHDILFYLGSEGASYSFTPEAGTTVTVARSTVGSAMTFNGFTSNGVSVAANGEVTVSSLTTGRHIIRVEKDGLATYQVVTARGVSYVMKDANGNELTSDTELNPGDTVTVQFTGLVSPKEKIAGAYNPRFIVKYVDENGTSFSGTAGMYNFSGTPTYQKVTITIPENADGYTYILSGAIAVIGYDGIPTHRGISYRKGLDRQYGTGASGVLTRLPELTLKLAGWAVNDAKTKIDAIGDVTLDSGAAIAAARAAYNALSDEQKAQLSNYDNLTAAETKLAQLQKDAISNVDSLIAAIGDDVTLDSESAVKAARDAYDALPSELRAKVSDYSKLTAAEAKLAQQKAAVSNVEKLIDDIGDDVTLASESAIKAARDAYDALSSQLQAKVSNYSKLTAAEAKLAQLRQQEKDAISNVEKLIDAIGDDVTLASESTIKAARDAYDALSSELQAKVSNYSKLTAAEAKLAALNLDSIYKTTGDYLVKGAAPSTGSIGGEWKVLGLARSGRNVPSADAYYASVVDYVSKTADAQERLDNKPTESARLILALTAIGKDVTNVGGHDLLKGLNSMDYIKTQSVNGPIFTLLALDSRSYAVSGDVTRDGLVAAILATQLDNGGWPVMKSKDAADIDMTAMAIQALAPYYSKNEAVKAAVDKALTFLSGAQTQDGGYAENVGGTNSSESAAQVLVALCAMKIDPLNDSRFIKSNHSVLDALCSYYVTGGGFKHTASGERNAMATEQCYYALAAYFRMKNGQNFLYDMTDVKFVCADGNHQGEWTVVKAATCTEDGTEKRTCTICGAEETRTIKAKGHTFGEWTVTKKATCTEKGSQTRTCSVCQTTETQSIAATGHTFGKWVVTKEATRTEKGLKTRTCSVCGATETQSIPATGSRPSNPGTSKPAEDVKSSQTGDNSQMTLWMGGVLLSAAALVVLSRRKKHSEE